MDETASVRGDIAELRHEMVRMEARVAAQLDRMASEIGRTRAELSAQIERSKADLMKWSFVFWCGAVAAIAALAGVLRT